MVFAIAGIAGAHVDTVKNGSLKFKMSDSADKITLIRSNGQAGYVTICVEAAPNITWWKGIDIYAGPDRKIGFVETQDGRGADCELIKTGEFAPAHARLSMMKAKGLGVHTHIEFKRFSPQAYNGKKMTFKWTGD
ncbi:MAG: hypothetical protein GY937_22770 [bacterium]|nr:hypothetical protein [bacterium]